MVRSGYCDMQVHPWRGGSGYQGPLPFQLLCDRDSDCVQDLGNVCAPPLPLWEQVDSNASSRSVTDVGPCYLHSENSLISYS